MSLVMLALTTISAGAFDPFGNRVPLDHAVAVQERCLTHEGLNLYDGATWELSLIHI